MSVHQVFRRRIIYVVVVMMCFFLRTATVCTFNKHGWREVLATPSSKCRRTSPDTLQYIAFQRLVKNEETRRSKILARTYGQLPDIVLAIGNIYAHQLPLGQLFKRHPQTGADRLVVFLE